MAEPAGALSFGFEADFSGFTRAAEMAGATLDRLGGARRGLGRRCLGGLSRTSTPPPAAGREAAAAIGVPRLGAPAGGLTRRSCSPATSMPDTSGDRDDKRPGCMTRLSEPLALLRTNGAAHDAIALR